MTQLRADVRIALLKLCQHMSCSFDQRRENQIAALHALLPLTMCRPLGHAEESLPRMQVSATVLCLLYSLIHPKETEIVASLDPQKLQARGCHPSGSSVLIILVGKSCVKHAFAISTIHLELCLQK